MKNIFTRTRRVTVLCVLTAFLIIPASVSFGQDFTTSVGQGAKALLFSFDGLANLGAREFNGGIGGKYFLTDPLALRIGIPFAFVNQSVPANPPAGVAGTDGSISGMRLGISGAVEYHLLKTRVSPYVGGGLGFTFTSTTIKPPATGAASQGKIEGAVIPDSVLGNAFVPGIGFNIGAIGGVELFIIKELSLSAEYQLGYSMLARADEKSTSGTQTTTLKMGTLTNIGISATGVITMSVYF
jgi:hypothetical protein